MTTSTSKVRQISWRSPGKVFAELHYALRTEGDSPVQRAGAVALGLFIGALPIYGGHLLLCIVFARLLRVNRVTTYLAAHVNNPLSAPFLLYVGMMVGHLIVSGRLAPLTLAHLRESSWSGIGLELLVGSLTVGVVLAFFGGVVTWAIANRRRGWPLALELRDEASRPYLDTGVFNWEFVRGKLRYDPLYMGLLQHGILPRAGTLLDLGCGRGILPALLITADRLRRDGRWSDWPSPPDALKLVGVERRGGHADTARTVLGERATIVTGDLTDVELPAADVIVLADVLHYLAAEDQEALIGRVASVLRPGGLLVLRECDAAAGARFLMTRVQERVCAIFRRDWRQRFHYRSAAGWRGLLETEGLSTAARAMWSGTPYSNVLIEARKGASPASRDDEA